MVKKKREAIRQITHPTDEQHPQEWIEIIYNDGSHDILDKDGNPLNAITVTAAQIEKWEKMPKKQATEDILKLINNPNLDVSEKRLILDAIWKLVELHGALEPAKDKRDKVVALRVNFINVSGQPSQIEQKSIDIEAKVIES